MSLSENTAKMITKATVGMHCNNVNNITVGAQMNLRSLLAHNSDLRSHFRSNAWIP
jgi:hypothetical protein